MSEKEHQVQIKTAGGLASISPAGKIEFTRAAKIGMELIKLYVARGAPERQIIGAVAATAEKMSPALARIFIDDVHRLGVVSEQGRAACLRLCKDHIGEAAPVH